MKWAKELMGAMRRGVFWERSFPEDGGSKGKLRNPLF